VALADKVLARTRALDVRVFVKGVPFHLNNPAASSDTPVVLGLNVRKSFDSPVPVCNLTLNLIPTWVAAGNIVQVDVGFDGEFQRVFNGYVQDRSIDALDRAVLSCAGQLFSAFRTIQISERDVDGITVEAALEGVLDYVGITDRALTVPAFTLGSASTAVLERDTAAGMLQTLMDIDGLRVWELGSGTVVIAAVDGTPAPAAFRKLTTDTDDHAYVLEGGVREDPTWFRSQVTVTGATITEGTPPDETSRTISASASVADRSLIQPPLPADTQIEAEFQNHLIDTDAKAEEVALRLINAYARVPQQVTLEIAGDPRLELGMTLNLSLPEFKLTGNWLIHGIEQEIGDAGYVTRVTLLGGPRFGGTLSLNPIAAFSYRIEREVFGDRVYAFVTFDAKASSYDPDGAIASFAWSDDEVTTPEIHTLTTAVVTVRIDPASITGDWSVTLTVTDNDGLTGAVTQVIDVDEIATLVRVPAIFAALDNNASATPDGGQNWNDRAGSTCRSVAAKPADGVNSGIAVFGFEDGHIARTTDFCATALTTVLAAVGSAIVKIDWDWRQPNRVWAVTDDARVYVSSNDGVTWALISNLRTELSLASATARSIGLPGGGGIFIWGGTGNGTPLIAYKSESGAFQGLTTGGELAADLPAASSALRIVDASDKGDGGGLVIVMENADGGTSGVRPIYHAVSPWQPATWKRATGLEAGNTTGRYVVPNTLPGTFYAAFNDRHVWASLDGIAWTKRTDVLPAGVTPNHAIWMNDHIFNYPTAGVYLIAAEIAGTTVGIYKSSDALVTVGALRPATGFPAWPASAKGRQVAIADRAPSGDDRLLATGIDVSPREYSLLQGGGWATPVVLTGVTGSGPRPICINSNLWFVINGDDGDNAWGWGVGRRTKDAGATWAATPDPGVGSGGIMDVARDAGGRLWCIVHDTADTFTRTAVYYSDNDGDTWNGPSFTYGNGTTQQRRGWRIAPHPTNQNRIAIIGFTGDAPTTGWIAITTDRGANWTTNTNSAIRKGQSGVQQYYDCVMLANNRLVAQGPFTVVAPVIWYTLRSDDNGVNWATVTSHQATLHRVLGIYAKGSVVAYIFKDSTPTPDTYNLYLSVDSGQTFVDTALDVELESLIADGAIPAAFAFSLVADALYLAITSQDKIYKLSPVGPTGAAWIDLTLNYPHSTTVNDNLAVIPT